MVRFIVVFWLPPPKLQIISSFEVYKNGKQRDDHNDRNSNEADMDCLFHFESAHETLGKARGSRDSNWEAGNKSFVTHYNKRRYGAIINIKYNVNCQNPVHRRAATRESERRDLGAQFPKHLTIHRSRID
jgi:hypothetical protein